MAKYLALENFFINGELHQASHSQPRAFIYPDEEVPNYKWRPLDKKAKEALDKLAKRTGVAVFDIPEQLKDLIIPAEKVDVVKPEKAADPNKLSQATVDALTDTGAANTAEAILKQLAASESPKGSRPSDREP